MVFAQTKNGALHVKNHNDKALLVSHIVLFAKSLFIYEF